MRTIGIAYGLIGCFFAGERLLRRGAAARSLATERTDQGSTRAVGRALGLSLAAMLVAPLLNRLRIGRLPDTMPGWGGLAAMLVGLLLRVWATRALGAFYTRTLRTSAEQRLVTDGPYRLIRHPGYLGTLLMWIGGGVATANWIVAAAVTFCLGRAYRRRIRAEEAMLAATFPNEYRGYARRTSRLIPFIY